jgi:hypothetical protein
LICALAGGVTVRLVPVWETVTAMEFVDVREENALPPPGVVFGTNWAVMKCWTALGNG